MSVQCVTDIYCDGPACNVSTQGQGMTAKRARSVELRRTLTLEGWFCSPFIDLCPNCNPRKR